MEEQTRRTTQKITDANTIDRLFVEIGKISIKLDTLQEKVNDQVHELDKRLALVEKFIENRSKMEFILFGAVIAEMVGVLFFMAQALFKF